MNKDTGSWLSAQQAVLPDGTEVGNLPLVNKKLPPLTQFSADDAQLSIKSDVRKEVLLTVGQLQDALAGIDRDIEISLSFLSVEGGHHGPNVFDVPFIVVPVKDDAGRIISVYLTEQ